MLNEKLLLENWQTYYDDFKEKLNTNFSLEWALKEYYEIGNQMLSEDQVYLVKKYSLFLNALSMKIIHNYPEENEEFEKFQKFRLGKIVQHELSKNDRRDLYAKSMEICQKRLTNGYFKRKARKLL